MTNTEKKTLTDTSLTAEERAAMKHDFMSFMEANPPVLERQRSSMVSPYFPHLMRAPAFIASFLVVMGGTAYAAENSLPNDFLYPIKTAVIEPLFFDAPARTELARAGASQKRVERRLDEAESLIDRNELDAESTAIIVAAVDKHAAKVKTFIAKASQAGELSEALDVGTDLENSLEAHGEVLEAIADESTATEAVTDLIEEIADHADEAESASEEVERQASETTTEESDEFLSTAGTEVRSSLASLRASLTAYADQEDELIAEAKTYLAQSEAAYAAGSDYLSLGQKSAAIPHMRDALQNAQQGLILLESYEGLDPEAAE